MVLFFEAISEMGNVCIRNKKKGKDIDPNSTVAFDIDESENITKVISEESNDKKDESFADSKEKKKSCN